MKRRAKRGVSLGTVVMLAVTCLVLAGFVTLLPRLSGAPDVRVNASDLAVAFDQTIMSFAKAPASPRAAATAQPKASAQPAQNLVTAAPSATPAPKLSFSLCASGSLKFNSAVQKALTDETGYRFELALEDLAPRLTSDLTIATLCNAAVTSEKLSDANIPPELLTALHSAGIDALCMGHYNALDLGISGVDQTRQSIAAAGMLPYGVYASQQERTALTLTNVNGITVALLSYQAELSSAGKKKTSSEEQGYAIANLQLPVISSEIASAKAQGAQVVIVSLCWGKTSAASPTDTQRQLAQSIADAGADVILGTRPEAVQSVEILTANRGDSQYHPVLCAYSLGNLFTYNREKRVSLAGVLLHAQVEYDPATGNVAFDDLAYTPAYNWRGKEDGVQRYRVLNSAPGTPPAYVDADQQALMERCQKTITDVMQNSPFTLRAK